MTWHQCRCGRWRWHWGDMRVPATMGHPVRAKITWRPTARQPPYPRFPWKYETESRAAGTGLIPGRMPCPPWVFPHPPWPPWETPRRRRVC